MPPKCSPKLNKDLCDRLLSGHPVGVKFQQCVASTTSLTFSPPEHCHLAVCQSTPASQWVHTTSRSLHDKHGYSLISWQMDTFGKAGILSLITFHSQTQDTVSPGITQPESVKSLKRVCDNEFSCLMECYQAFSQWVGRLTPIIGLVSHNYHHPSVTKSCNKHLITRIFL